TNGVNMESDPESDTFSESGEVSDLNADKLDPTERVLYEKLKQQEREEREEIERELKEHEEAIAMHSNHLRAREKEMHLVQERMQQRSERELDLSRPSSNKSLSNSNGSVNGGDSSNNNGSSSHAGNKPSSNNNSNNNNNLKNSLPCGNNISNIHKSFSNGGSGVGMLKNSCDNTLDMSKFLTEDFRAHLHNSANLLSTFPLGHPLAHAHLALGGHLLGREMKGLEMVNPFHPILPNHSAFPSPPSPSERYPPSSTTPISPTGSLRPSPSPDDPNGENRSHNWTFEEQFKQLVASTYDRAPTVSWKLVASTYDRAPTVSWKLVASTYDRAPTVSWKLVTSTYDRAPTVSWKLVASTYDRATTVSWKLVASTYDRAPTVSWKLVASRYDRAGL
ncbi:AT-rich interactive domain-containing protein 1A, partial [Biomphalaria glabrata]